MVNDEEYYELGIACADICNALDRGIHGRRVNELSPSVFIAIEKLTT
jgi:hypothetical protein